LVYVFNRAEAGSSSGCCCSSLALRYFIGFGMGECENCSGNGCSACDESGYSDAPSREQDSDYEDQGDY